MLHTVQCQYSDTTLHTLMTFEYSLSQTGATPLFFASQENHEEVVKILLSSGAKVDLATKVRKLL